MKSLKLKDIDRSVINLEKVLSCSLMFENKILSIFFKEQNEEERYYYERSRHAEFDYNRIFNQ